MWIGDYNGDLTLDQAYARTRDAGIFTRAVDVVDVRLAIQKSGSFLVLNLDEIALVAAFTTSRGGVDLIEALH